MCNNWTEESTNAADLAPVYIQTDGNKCTIRFAIDDCISLFQLLFIYNIHNNININIKNNINNNNITYSLNENLNSLLITKPQLRILLNFTLLHYALAKLSHFITFCGVTKII